MGATKEIDAATFEAEVLNGSIPAVVDFSATWCGPCKALAPAIDEMAQEYDGKVLICKVDIDQAPDLATRYGVMSVPTVLFFKDGEKVDQVSGNLPDKIRQKIQGLL